MEYNIKFTVEYRKKFENENKLDPRDFIDCDTISELKSKIVNKFNLSNIEYSTRLNEKLEIPDEFIKEWKELVQFIPGNVMTYRLKDKWLRDDDTYTETYSGEYLNNKKHEYNWNTLISIYIRILFSIIKRIIDVIFANKIIGIIIQPH